MDTHNENKKGGEMAYEREELQLGSFILHAHADREVKGYISCQCDEQCQYVLLNDLKKIQCEYVGEEDERQLFEQSKNNGHPDSLIKPILKHNISLLDYLIEIYSIYMHLQIEHTVIAELLFPIQFADQDEKNNYMRNFQGHQLALIFSEQPQQYIFTIFTFKTKLQSIAQKQIFVSKHNKKGELEQKLAQESKKRLVVSENEWIVMFSWLLKNKNDFSGNYSPQYSKLVASIRSHSQILEGKLDEIRRRSYTRLYDFCSYWSGQQ